MKIALKKYWVFILLFSLLSCSEKKIPTIDIVPIETTDWKNKNKCVIIYSNDNISNTLSGRIKFRGGMSSRYFKHSYTLELDSLTCLDGLACNDDYIINASYIDKSFMRHKISYDLFREMNSENKSVKSTYVNVKVNNVYEGLYLLMEKINASFLGLNKSDTMAMLFKDPSIFRTKPYKNSDTLNIYNQRFPKFSNTDKTYYLSEFRDFLFNSSDEEFTNSIGNWIDVKNVIDWHLLLLLTNNGDGLQKNFYLYKKNKDTPFKIAIWDYDHTFGRDGDNEKNNFRNVMFCENSILLNRLLNITDTKYKQNLVERWHELRGREVISVSNMSNLMDENYSIIQNEAKKNSLVWPGNEKWYFDDYSIEEELQFMKTYISYKINSLDDYFMNL